jgi:hypothetical protein
VAKALTYSSSISVGDSTKTLLVIGGVATVGLLAWIYSKNASVASTAPSPLPDTTPNLPVVQTTY